MDCGTFIYQFLLSRSVINLLVFEVSSVAEFSCVSIHNKNFKSFYLKIHLLIKLDRYYRKTTYAIKRLCLVELFISFLAGVLS